MIAVKADEASVKRVIEEVRGSIDIAAYNSPSDFAVAGTEEEMRDLKNKMDQKKMDSVELSNVKKAFHSKHVQDVPGLSWPRFRLVISKIHTAVARETENIQNWVQVHDTIRRS